MGLSGRSCMLKFKTQSLSDGRAITSHDRSINHATAPGEGMIQPSPFQRYYTEVGEYTRSITDISLTTVLSLTQMPQGDNYKWSERISDHSNIHQYHRQSIACGIKKCQLETYQRGRPRRQDARGVQEIIIGDKEIVD